MAGRGAARRNDQVTGMDTHIVLVPSASGTVPTPLQHPFSGRLSSSLSSNVKIDGQDAATEGSVAPNQPPHVPTPPGTSFQKQPADRGTVSGGSSSVLINGKKAARLGDPVRTCNDPFDSDAGKIVAGSTTVLIG